MGMIYAILSEIRDAKKGASYKAASRTRKPLSRAVRRSLRCQQHSHSSSALVPDRPLRFLGSASGFQRGSFYYGRLRPVRGVLLCHKCTSSILHAQRRHHVRPPSVPRLQVGSHDFISDLVMFFAIIALWVVAFFFAVGMLVAYIRTRREPEPWAVIDHAAVTRDAVVVGVLLVGMGARASYVPLVINPAPDFALAISEPFRCRCDDTKELIDVVSCYVCCDRIWIAGRSTACLEEMA
jgi:hypothetical protein